ncbi:hypothetical protein ACFX2I_012758 [Malus domestica]
MPGLDRTLVKHELRIKAGCKPFRQPPRRFSTEVQLGIKDKLVRLLKARFIQTARYVEWLANIVSMLKKNDALRICIDFRNLNLATPKDEYPMPISNLLIDAAAHHKIISFIDGHVGYNQISSPRPMSTRLPFGVLGHSAHTNGSSCPSASRTPGLHTNEL